jgi:hypothetical protein
VTRDDETFKQTGTPEEARLALERDVPPGAGADQARAWLDSREIPFADDGDALHFTIDGPHRSPMVFVRWIFHLSIEGGRVTGAEVEEGLVGP